MAAEIVNLNLLTLDAIAQQEQTRMKQIRRRWEWFDGDMPDVFRVDLGKPNPNVKANYIRTFVNKGASFLFGQGVEFQLDEDKTTAEEAWLEECWQHNQRDILLLKWALSGANAGHAFIMLNPPAEGERFPRLVLHDPQTVTVSHEDDDIDDVWRYRIQYNGVDRTGPRPKTVVKRKDIERDDAGVWTISDYVSHNEGSRWVQVGETEVWPFTWPPIIDNQNLPAPHEYYGKPDAEDDLLDLNHVVNRVLSNWSKILDYHAHPRTYVTGAADVADLGSWDPDEIKGFQGTDVRVQNVEMQSELTSSQNFYRELVDNLHEEGRVPRVATGKVDDIGNLSGVALAILYQPLLELTNTKRKTYGAALVELNRRLLEMGGFGSDRIVTLVWPELLPKNQKEDSEVALNDLKLGVSQETLMERRGYDPDTEKKRRADEALVGVPGNVVVEDANDVPTTVATGQRTAPTNGTGRNDGE